jgi:hypothetical protein
VKRLVLDEFVEVEGEGGVVMDRTETAGGAFELESDVGVGFAAFANGDFDLFALALRAESPGVLFQLPDVFGDDLDLDFRDGDAGEELVGFVGFLALARDC